MSGKLTFRPRPYQTEDLRRIYDFHGRALLAWDQGLGKTPEAIWWTSKIPKRRPVLIVTPSSVKYNWQHEAWHFFKLRARVLEGQGPKGDGKLVLKDDIIILNYDILYFWLKVLARNPPKVLILDECQYVSNPRARRTRAAKAVSMDCESILGLSGTPAMNRPIQLWAPLNIIRPDLFPNYNDFGWEYCKPRMTPWGLKFDGAARKKQLRRILLKHVMIRRLKKDVAPDIPDKTVKMIPVKFGPKAQAEYKRATEKFLTWLRERSPAKANRARKAEAMVKFGYLLRLCAELRMPKTIEFIEDFHKQNPGKKLVGLTRHRFVIDQLRDEFPACVVVDGRYTGRLRHEAVRKFTTHKKTKDLWGNWVAAGTGLNLQVASNLIGLDPPQRPGDLNQGPDRVHRIGQTKKVMVWLLYAMGTVEEKWLKILLKRAVDLKDIMDGESQSQATDAAFTEMLGELTKMKV